MKFGLDEKGEVRIEGYSPQRNSGGFSADELRTLYLLASNESEALQKDKTAASLLQEYVSQFDLERGFNSSPKCEVYSLESLSPEQLDIKRHEKKDKKKQERRKGRYHETDSTKECFRCTISGIDGHNHGDQAEAADPVISADDPGTPLVDVFAGKKYKPVALKVRPVYTEVPEKYRIKREIKGDPLKDLPTLPTNPGDFVPTGRYTEERKGGIDKIHEEPFLWSEERKLMHSFMSAQNEAFAWDDNERGTWRHDFFPPVEIPTVEHKVWVERSIPIPRGQLEEFCKVIKKKIDAGVYEPSNSSYRSKFFGVLKKDGKSIRLVHALEPLNAVTIAHSGLPPATDELASHFAGRACGAVFDLYSGYDHRDIAESSRDFTSFQTPFGALRLVKLPQGWTNSVPIFHDDVTYILRDEIPHVTIPYIDDVPIRGPGTRYQDKDGNYETIPENKGIRRFVWEHFQNLNRVAQRLKYCGGTISASKVILCKEEFAVVGHTCSFEGRKPSTDRIGVILRWPALEDVSQVRQFLGTVGTMRMFIRSYSLKARRLNRLLRAEIEFEWGDAEQASMDAIKDALKNCEALKPLNYEWDSDIVLAVDTSYIAVGIEIYQRDPVDPTKRYFAKFDSIPLNEREARFSQPKRELYGLKRALTHMQYWLLGCRKLVVETDAMYIKGMLDNPGMGPNATINRWIEEILMFHFTLKHVKGLTFSPDGLSRRRKQPGDPDYSSPEDGFDENPSPEKHPDWDEEIEQPYEFEQFKKGIDTRGGYFYEMVTEKPASSNFEAFEQLCWKTYSDDREEADIIRKAYQKENLEMPQFIMSQIREEEPMLPPDYFKFDPSKREEYPENHRSEAGILQDAKLKLIRDWLKDPVGNKPKGYSGQALRNFMHHAKKFFLDKGGRLFRKGLDSAHKLVVEKEHRMYIMRASHDSLGHRGTYATKSLIEVRFWWPEFERDVNWYIKTCHMCQVRQEELLRIPPVPTMTPSLFQKVHTDVMIMGVPSNGHKYVVASRDSLSRWLESKALRSDNAPELGRFLLENIICRWGCPKEIVTDNAPQFLAALEWLNNKYGITGIRISPYNSKANGPVETGHKHMRQMIYKATGGDVRKWFWFLPQIVWADRITTRRGLGCSPYFAATGCHPVVPLDIVEATWLVDYPGEIISTAELVGLRARALAKHQQHIEDMRERVDAEKLKAVKRYEQEHANTIKDHNFQPGDLVLIRNTRVEKSLNKKLDPKYLGPMVIVRQTLGGSYVVCELNGAVYPGKIGAFRVIPYFARKSIHLKHKIEQLIDMSKEDLDKLVARKEKKDSEHGRDLQFGSIRLNPDWESMDPADLSDEPEEEYIEDIDLDDLDAPRTGPRRSKRLKK